MIEHTDVEIAEEQPEPSRAHVHAADRPSAGDVIREALALRLPCPVCKREDPCRCLRPVDYSPTNERASLIEKALTLYGYLPDGEESVFDHEGTAQWLAERSAHPRYVQVADGWRRLLEAEADVELAAFHATKRVPTEEVNLVKAARSALLEWQQAQKV